MLIGYLLIVSLWLVVFSELFYRATQLCYSAVFGSRYGRNCPSAVRQNQTMHCGYSDTTRKDNHSSFTPLPSKICAQSGPLRKTPSSTDFCKTSTDFLNRKR